MATLNLITLFVDRAPRGAEVYKAWTDRHRKMSYCFRLFSIHDMPIVPWGYSQLCLMLTTLAPISHDAKAFDWANRDDIDGLRELFYAELVASTDRAENLWLLLHVGPFAP